MILAMTTSSTAAIPPTTPSTTQRRVIAGILAAPCAAVLGVAAWLTPSTEGLGTHTALKMRECGWITMWDVPCPTCGMTTSFAHAADGNLWLAAKTQPMGAVLAVLTAITLILALHVLFTGSSVLRAFGSLWTTKIAWTIGGLAFIAWIFKIASYRGIL